MTQTALVKRSIEKDGLPKKSGTYITNQGERGYYEGQKGFYRPYNTNEVQWYLEELPLSQLIEEVMPTEDRIGRALLEKDILHYSVEEELAFKKGIEWLKNKLTK